MSLLSVTWLAACTCLSPAKLVGLLPGWVSDFVCEIAISCLPLLSVN